MTTREGPSTPTRLMNHAGNDPAAARAAELLASLDLSEADDPALARRVRARLAGVPTKRGFALRPVFVGAIVLCASAAVAGATVGRPYLLARLPWLGGATSAPAPRAATHEHHAPPAPQAAREPEAPPVATVEEPAAPPRRAHVASATDRPRARLPERVTPAEAPVPKVTPADADAALVMDAMAKLRARGTVDAAAARASLDLYLARQPQGALAEEAHALLIEASREPAEARAAARRYVARYPNGRFAAVARRVLTSRP